MLIGAKSIQTTTQNGETPQYDKEDDVQLHEKRKSASP